MTCQDCFDAANSAASIKATLMVNPFVSMVCLRIASTCASEFELSTEHTAQTARDEAHDRVGLLIGSDRPLEVVDET